MKRVGRDSIPAISGAHGKNKTTLSSRSPRFSQAKRREAGCGDLPARLKMGWDSHYGIHLSNIFMTYCVFTKACIYCLMGNT
jgi:hypothetical protein